MTEECCAGKAGKTGYIWHRRNGTPICKNAQEESEKFWARAREVAFFDSGAIKRWTPGSPILVPEIDPL